MIILTKTPFISIILLHYNGKDILDSCMAELFKTDYPNYEIVLVDNGSTDDSVEFVRKKYGKLRILTIKKNIGFTGGNNFGISEILKENKADYIALISNDVMVDKNWLKPLVEKAESGKSIGACGPMVFNTDGTVQSYGPSMNLFGAVNLVKKSSLKKEFVEPFFLSGCCFIIKKEVLKNLDYFFDPDFFAFFDDVDLSWRIRILGYKLVCVKKSKVTHKGSVSIKLDRKRGNIYYLHHYKNKILAFRKNLRTPIREMLFIPLFFTVLFQSMRLSLIGKWGYGISVLKYFFISKSSKNLDKISLKKQLKFFFPN